MITIFIIKGGYMPLKEVTLCNASNDKIKH